MKTEQELRDEFDILSIEQKIEWALDTIRHKETFGMDELNASLSRERRAKGVLLDCKKTIEKQKKESETLDGIIKYQLDQIKFKDAEIAKLLQQVGFQSMAITEARELINKANFKFLLQDETEQLEEKAKAWLEENKLVNLI